VRDISEPQDLIEQIALELSRYGYHVAQFTQLLSLISQASLTGVPLSAYNKAKVQP
jgi:hypothetical protein